MVRRAKELAERHGWFLASQFENEANLARHRSTTGPEIPRATSPASAWTTSSAAGGTGGTITGAGEVLPEAGAPDLKVIAMKVRRARPPVRRGSRTRSVAGRRTSCRRCCRAPSPTRSCRWTTCWRGDHRAAARCREDLPRRLPRRDRPPRLRVADGAKPVPRSRMLPDTGERYLSTILFEGISAGLGRVAGVAKYRAAEAALNPPVGAPARMPPISQRAAALNRHSHRPRRASATLRSFRPGAGADQPPVTNARACSLASPMAWWRWRAR